MNWLERTLRARTAIMILAIVTLAGLVGCGQIAVPSFESEDEPSPAVDEASAAEDARDRAAERSAELTALEEALAAAQAESQEARQAVDEMETAMDEREARLAKRESQLQEVLALEARRAEVRDLEQQLGERTRVLDERERLLEAREFDVTVREDSVAEAEKAAPDDPLASEEVIGEVVEDAAGVGDYEAKSRRAGEGTASLQPGKVMEVEMLETISSRTHRVGDTFAARLVQDLRNEDGVLVIPAGAEIGGVVTHVQPLEKLQGRAEIGIEFTQVVVSPDETVRIRASMVELGKDRSKGRKKVLLATAAGAILGRVLGGDAEGAVAGAAVGAAASTAAVASAKGKDAEIPAGEIIALQLEEVVTVEIEMTGTAEGFDP